MTRKRIWTTLLGMAVSGAVTYGVKAYRKQRANHRSM